MTSLVGTRGEFADIPVVDLSGAAHEVAAGVAAACERVGFLYVTGHGVADELVAHVFAQATWFFGRPQAERDALDVAASPNFRGYVPMGLVGPGMPRRMLEAFQIMLELDASDPDVRAGNVMYGPNRWPPGAPHFREVLTSYYEAMERLADRLLGAFAVGLGLDAEFFRPFFRKPLTQLRLLHYPSQPAEDGDALGVEAHTDTGAFTVLAQDANAGLEVRNRAGEWISAPPIPGTFVVNIADMMQCWTNGRFVSTPHRVANRSGRDRHSVPFFVNPDYAARIEPLPQFAASGRPSEHVVLDCGPYVEAAYRAAWPRLGG